MNATPLMPCPYCGGPGRIHDDINGHGNRVYKVECADSYDPDCPCEVRPTTFWEDEWQAVKAWNRRAPAAAESIPPGKYSPLTFAHPDEAAGSAEVTEVSEGLFIYREKRDLFIVSARDESTESQTRYSLLVLNVIQNDPHHGIQYAAGDVFSVMTSKVIPGADAYKEWDMEPIAAAFQKRRGQ